VPGVKIHSKNNSSLDTQDRQAAPAPLSGQYHTSCPMLCTKSEGHQLAQPHQARAEDGRDRNSAFQS
jgi:hypothetical protein